MPKDQRKKQTDVGLHKVHFVRGLAKRYNLGSSKIGFPHPKVGGGGFMLNYTKLVISKGKCT